MLRAWYGLNQSGTGWTKCGLTPEWGSLTPEWGSLTPEWASYILTNILGHEMIVEGDALILFWDLRVVFLSLR